MRANTPQPAKLCGEAIRDWQAKRASHSEDTRYLRKAWEEGKFSGAATPMDFDALRKEARERLAEIRG